MKTLFSTLMAIACLTAAAACSTGGTGKPQAQPVSKVLFMVGTSVHDSKELPALMEKVLEGTGRFDVTISTDRDLFTASRIKDFDLVLIYTTGGNLSREQEEGLVGFVESGGGLVGIHSATDSFKNSDAYWKLLGGRFIGHGGGTFRVKITGKSHPVVKGMSGFTISDETYRHKFHPDSKLIVLMRREEDGEPASWVQYVGKGRVFVTGLGHGYDAWSNPSFQEMIVRAMDWAACRLNP